MPSATPEQLWRKLRSMYRSIAAVVFTCFAPAAIAANFTNYCENEYERIAGCVVKMTGEIAPGDAKRLAAALRDKPPHSGMYRTLVLDSPGGDVAEALRISEVVRQAVLETATNREPDFAQITFDPRQFYFKCASACFLVWAAGARRQHVSSNASSLGGGQPIGLGLHRPFLSSDEYATADMSSVARKQQEMTEVVRQYLRREAIPDQLIEEMMRRSSREILWLDSFRGSPQDIPDVAPWFEEMLIARCNYDPVKDREEQARMAEIITAQRSTPRGSDTRRRDFVTWKQKVNACEYNTIRIPAQSRFR